MDQIPPRHGHFVGCCTLQISISIPPRSISATLCRRGARIIGLTLESLLYVLEIPVAAGKEPERSTGPRPQTAAGLDSLTTALVQQFKQQMTYSSRFFALSFLPEVGLSSHDSPQSLRQAMWNLQIENALYPLPRCTKTPTHSALAEASLGGRRRIARENVLSMARCY